MREGNRIEKEAGKEKVGKMKEIKRERMYIVK